MTQRVALIALAFCALTVRPQTFTVSPTQPDDTSNITIHAEGTWPQECPPGNPRLVINGFDIRVDLIASGDDCFDAWRTWTTDIDLGQLDAGLYNVQFFINGNAYRRLTLPVSTSAFARPLAVIPTAAPSTGGLPVMILIDRPYEFCLCEPLTATFGGVPATDVKRGNDYNLIVATAPPHAAGAVDIELTNAVSNRLTMPRAFIYFDESAPPDPVMFEPLLFPLLGELDGFAGTHWKAEAVLVNFNPESPVVTQRALDATRFLAPRVRHVVSGSESRPRGVIWLPLRQRFIRGTAALFVHETTHGSSFELPVVRQNDFATNVYLTGIPRDTHHRVTLRIYSLDDPAPLPHLVNVFVTGIETTFPRAWADLSLIRMRDDEPWFAQLPDLNALAFEDYGHSPDPMVEVWISSPGQRIWAFASIVDNDTQQVRIVTPLK